MMKVKQAMKRLWPSFLPKNMLRPIAALSCMGVFVAVANWVLPWQFLIMRNAILWNVFLAAMPLVFACLIALAVKRGFRWYGQVLLWLLWIGFYPNVIYMLTDLIHLNIRQYVFEGDFTTNPRTWFALLHLVAAIVVGCGFGLLSLWLLHRITAKKNAALGWALAIGASGLSGIGIWIGRCLRFNTWDIWQRPFHLIQEIVQQIDRRAVFLCLVFAVMSFGAYALVWSFLGKEETA